MKLCVIVLFYKKGQIPKYLQWQVVKNFVCLLKPTLYISHGTKDILCNFDVKAHAIQIQTKQQVIAEETE